MHFCPRPGGRSTTFGDNFVLLTAGTLEHGSIANYQDLTCSCMYAFATQCLLEI